MIFAPNLFSLGYAQQTSATAGATSRNLQLNVIVTPKSGVPVTGLQKDDFTLTDNKSPRQITSFKVASAVQEPVKIILLIDAVNTDFSRVAFMRTQVQNFLKLNGGHLAHPTSIAVLTDKGVQLQNEFSVDGNALSASLDSYTVGLREITRDSGIWGADERVQISLTAMQQLTSYAGSIPGRKIVLWVSPGWPLLSGARIELDGKQQQQIFADVVSFSKELQRSNLTLYSINPLGPGEGLAREDYYESFVKGISNPNQTDLGDLSLQVLAIQSGGLALNGSNDVVGALDRSVGDTKSWYEVTFETLAAEKPNEYHHIVVTVDKPGLTARTRDGYYAQP
jgi:VWFA-related protein